jgi:hypothetical protein
MPLTLDRAGLMKQVRFKSGLPTSLGRCNAKRVLFLKEALLKYSFNSLVGLIIDGGSNFGATLVWPDEPTMSSFLINHRKKINLN